MRDGPASNVGTRSRSIHCQRKSLVELQYKCTCPKGVGQCDSRHLDVSSSPSSLPFEGPTRLENFLDRPCSPERHAAPSRVPNLSTTRRRDGAHFFGGAAAGGGAAEPDAAGAALLAGGAAPASPPVGGGGVAAAGVLGPPACKKFTVSSMSCIRSFVFFAAPSYSVLPDAFSRNV